MNISIISTYKEKVPNVKGDTKKLSRVLLEIAESHLASPETSHYISRDGVEKVKRKLTTE